MPTTPHSDAGWRIDPPVSDPKASGANPAATAAADPPDEPAGHAAGVERVAGRPERRVLGARSHRELVEIGLADDHGTGLLEPGDDRRVVGRHPSLEDARRARGDHAASAHVVLQCDRHTGQRPGIVTCGDGGVDGGGALARPIGDDHVEGMDLGSRLSIVARCCSSTSAARHLAGSHAGGDLDHRRPDIHVSPRRRSRAARGSGRPRPAAPPPAPRRDRGMGSVDVLTHDVDAAGTAASSAARPTGRGRRCRRSGRACRRAALSPPRARSAVRLEPSQAGDLGDDLAGDPIRHDRRGYRCIRLRRRRARRCECASRTRRARSRSCRRRSCRCWPTRRSW